jgi:large subunit ribosomal protein L4
MKLDVLGIDGQSTGRSADLSDEIFGQDPNKHAVYLAIKSYNAGQHRGTHSTKERNAVVGSTRKIKRQKGTGTARAGDIKNPIFRGGGRAFGPQPRDYGVKLNKKVSKLARKSAFSDLAKNGNLLIVEDFSFDQPKTKEYKRVLEGLEVNDVKTLLITSESEREVYLSSRNLQNSKVVNIEDLSIYDLLSADKVILSESTVEKINEVLA